MSDASVTDPDAQYDVARQLEQEGNLEGAVEALEKILADHPDHLQTHLALGVHLQKLGRIEEAVKHTIRVTELDPQDPFSWVQMSLVMQRCGRIQEAEDAMARANAMRASQG